MKAATLLAVFAITSVAGGALANDAGPTLEQVLDGLDRTARLYKDEALRFTCNERIRHYTHNKVRTYRFRYIYVNRGGDLDDFRIPAGKTRKKIGPGWGEGTLRGFGLPSSLRRAYSWIFVFEASKASYYRYEIVGEETLFGRRAILVRFEPVPPYMRDINEFFGTAWVDAEKFLILRVQAIHHRDHARKLRVDEARANPDRKNPRMISYEQMDTEFAVEKRGLRLPTEVVVRQALYRVPGDYSKQGYQIFLLKQRYRKYRFFGVATEQRIEMLTADGEVPEDFVDASAGAN